MLQPTSHTARQDNVFSLPLEREVHSDDSTGSYKGWSPSAQHPGRYAPWRCCSQLREQELRQDVHSPTPQAFTEERFPGLALSLKWPSKWTCQVSLPLKTKTRYFIAYLGNRHVIDEQYEVDTKFLHTPLLVSTTWICIPSKQLSCSQNQPGHLGSHPRLLFCPAAATAYSTSKYFLKLQIKTNKTPKVFKG